MRLPFDNRQPQRGNTMIRNISKSFPPILKTSTLLVSLLSGYGRALAGTCIPVGLGVYNCKYATTPADSSQIFLTTTPLTVTTSPGFGIDTTNTGGDALNLVTSGSNLTFTDNNASTIIGANNGIYAINQGTGALSITSNGTVIGKGLPTPYELNNIVFGSNANGILAINSPFGSDLNISTNNVYGMANGINAINFGSGALTISSSGNILGMNSSGILAVNFSPYSTDLNISVTNVSGKDAGIYAGNMGSGILSISSSGNISSSNGVGIYAVNLLGNDVNISVNNVSGLFGIVASNLGDGALSITSSGDVSGTYGFGIYAYNSSNGTNLDISTANVSGGYYGILAANLGNGTLSISSSGTVSGLNGYGIYAYNSSNGTDLIISVVDVSGNSNGIHTTTTQTLLETETPGGFDAITAINLGSGTLSITSSGTVSGINGYGIYAYNSSNGTDLDISSKDVYGKINGITAVNFGSGALSISSNGNVSGTNLFGIFAANYSPYSTDLNITVSNVSGEEAGILAGNFGSGALSISSSGNVSTSYGVGIYAINFNGTDLTISAKNASGEYGIAAVNLGNGELSISTSGNVSGTNGCGIYAYNSSSGTNLDISTTNVSGYYYGILAANHGNGTLSINSSGTVSGTNGYGIYAYNSSNGTNLNISTANVSGSIDGITGINLGSGALSITSSGTVSGTNGYGINALNNGGQPTTINVGSNSIIQGNLAGITVNSTTGQSNTININGQVRNVSGQSTDYAIIANGTPTTVNLRSGSVTTGIIDLSDKDDTVNLRGSLNGSIKMDDGDDTFIQAGFSVLNGVADGGDGSDTLGFDNIGIINGDLMEYKYLNFENLGIYGGNTTLTGTWNFSNGTATIYQGNLYVNGSMLTTLLTVEENGLLGGNGEIFGDVVVYGSVSPGNSIGTLNVNGSVNFMSSSIYVAELGAHGGDVLKVDGSVSINNARLATSLERSLYADGHSWRIINANGGINGNFSSISTDFTSYTVNLNLVTHGDSLSVVIDRTPYASFGKTANQSAVGTAFDKIIPTTHGAMADLLLTMDFAMNPSMITATLAGLSPQMYTSLQTSGLSISETVTQTIDLRQQEIGTLSALSDEKQGNQWNVWGHALGSWLDRDGQANISSYTMDSDGMLFGLDKNFGSMARAGLLLGHSNSDFSSDKPGQTGEITGKHVALYGIAKHANFYLYGTAGYTTLDNNAYRLIKTPAFTSHASSSFESNVWAGNLSGGYDFTFGTLRIGPTVSLNYHKLNQDSFCESGGEDFNIQIQESSAKSLNSSLGMRLAGQLQYGEWQISPNARLSLQHQSNDDAVTLEANFVDYSQETFTITGVDPLSDKIMTNFGLSAYNNKNLSLYLDFTITKADELNSTLLTGGVAWAL